MEKLIQKIEIPEGIQLTVEGTDVKATGNGKENSRHFKSTEIVLKKTDNGLEVYTKKEKKNIIAEAKTVASHIKNMISGIQNDYIYRLEVVYSHFPMNVTVKDGFVEINNLAGAKHPRKAKILGNVKVEVKGKDVTVTGHNKEEVGQTAANMEQATKIKGKDIRIYQDGIYITEKAKTK
ncbi:50S ribosomal protein L6 [archaeon]|nr:50S ribosomal protein L6 [archaeon]